MHTNGLHPGAGFVFEDESLHFGGVVAGTVEVRSGEPELRSGTLRVQQVAGRPESKSETEVVYDEYTVLASLPEGEAMTVPFRFKLPRTVPPGQELLLRVLLEEWTALLRRLEVRTGFEAELDWPRELPVDAGALARLTVRNVTRDTLRDVTVDLDMPFALEADDQTRQSLGDLGQGEEREVTWNVRAVASLDSGSVHAAVATSNNGSLLIRRSFRIPGAAEPVSDATPAYLPT